MIKDLVSIIVPVYNVEKFLPDCLSSIANQTYKNIEVIFVNDGSTDSSQILLQEFCNKYSYAKLINQTNQGPSIARNIGLLHSSGEYITFVDSDDIAHPLLIEKFVETIKKFNCDFVSSDFEYMESSEKYLNIKFENCEACCTELDKQQFISTYVSHWNNTTSWSMWNKMFKCEMVRQLPNWPDVLPTDMSLGEDLYFFTQYLKLSNKAIHINQQLYFYRKSNLSLVHQKYSKKRFNVFKALDHLIDENKLNEQDMNTVKALQAWHGIEALWAMKRARYDDKEDIKYVYKNVYKKYLKYFWKAKNQPRKMKIMPLSIPVMWVVYRIALIRANKK